MRETSDKTKEQTTDQESRSGNNHTKNRKSKISNTRVNGTRRKPGKKDQVYTFEQAQERTVDRNSNAAADKPTRASNNPGWYMSDSQLVANSVRIPWNWRTGDLLSNSLGAEFQIPSERDYASNFRVPGVLAYELAPMYGYDFSPTGPINTGAQLVYNRVIYQQVKVAPYDPSDLMQYFIAMSNVYSAINWATRAFGTVNAFTMENRYLPLEMFKPQGLDYDSFATDLAKFRYNLNTVINRASQFATPTELTLFARRAEMFSYYWLEDGDLKNQMYMFTPHGFHFYRSPLSPASPEFDTVSVPSLIYMSLRDLCIKWKAASLTNLYIEWEPDRYVITAEGLTHLIDLMLSSLFYSQDINRMSADVLAAYPNGYNVLSPLGMDALAVIAEPDDYIKGQLCNMVVLGQDIESNNIVQDPNNGRLLVGGMYVKFTGKVTDLYKSFELNALKNITPVVYSKQRTPEAEWIMDATRGMFFLEQVDGSDFSVNNVDADRTYLVHAGDFVCINAKVITMTPVGGFPEVEWDNYHTVVSLYNDGNAVNTVNPALRDDWWCAAELVEQAQLACFKYAFAQFFMFFTGDRSARSEEVYSITTPLARIDNVATLRQDQLDRIHQTALIGLFDVPYLAKWSSAHGNAR